MKRVRFFQKAFQSRGNVGVNALANCVCLQLIYRSCAGIEAKILLVHKKLPHFLLVLQR